MELTPQEEQLMADIRRLVPYEKLVIEKDKMGKPNMYLVQRSQKIIISEVGVIAVK